MCLSWPILFFTSDSINLQDELKDLVYGVVLWAQSARLEDEVGVSSTHRPLCSSLLWFIFRIL